ncbi:MAG: hypothetical protein ACR2OZ_01335 [Verrucomicrobiales bacterium]
MALALPLPARRSAALLSLSRSLLGGVIFLLTSAAQASKVTIDHDGLLVIGGKKVFPIGFTMPPPPDGKTPAGRNGIEELHDAGATFLRTGVMGTEWNDAAFELEQKYQDAAARYGMHCLVNLRELGSIGPEDAAKEATLRKLINRFKDHPGMGMWKHVDEPEWGKHPIPPMLRVTEIIRELDPNHPIEITQAPRGTVESLKPYNATTDIIAADIYPVGYPPGTHSLLPNKEISMVGDYTRKMMEVAGGRMPVWMTLQISWSGVIKPGKTLRFPTFAEERFMTYQAIINGARGLIYFGGHIPKAMSAEDSALGWNWRFWQRVLRPVIEEIGEKSPLYPALIAPNSKLLIQTNGATDVEFCVREAGDELFILACKREGATVNVNFTGLPAWAKQGQVMFEPPRSVEAREGKLTDWFGPFEVHVYRFGR